MPVPSQLVFDVGVSSLCTDITTIDDGVFEGNETFLVSLSSANANVDVSGSTATVVIIDTNGIKQYCLYLQPLSLKFYAPFVFFDL